MCVYSGQLREFEDVEMYEKEEAIEKVREMVMEALHIGKRDWGQQKLSDDEYETYAWFYDKFVKAVVGFQKYKRNQKHGMLGAYTTRSDEALAHLLLENNLEYWISQHRYPMKKPTKQHKAEKWAPKVYSMESGGKNATLGGGWTEQGHAKFSELMKVAGRRRMATVGQEMVEWTKFQTKYKNDKVEEAKKRGERVRDQKKDGDGRQFTVTLAGDFDDLSDVEGGGDKQGLCESQMMDV